MVPPTKEPMRCKCGHMLAEAYYQGGTFIGALAGGMFINESAHGRCAGCGRGVHFVVSTKELIRLMSHYSVPNPFTLEIAE